MALTNYGPDGSVLTINGRLIADFGENASPFVDEPIDPKTSLRRGQGGKAVRLNRKNPGRRVQVYLNPGSPDSAYVQGLFTSNANITLSWTQIGTLEAAIGTDGVITNDAAMNRAGTTISDDQYTFEFNVWNGTKGGV
jgi:hypothetical protein